MYLSFRGIGGILLLFLRVEAQNGRENQEIEDQNRHSVTFMKDTLSPTQEKAFEQLLSVWNNQQELRVAQAPFDDRITALQHVHDARMNLHATRIAA